MKECPRCGFTFPNFHRVCDFDGAELVPEERPSIINLSRPKSRFRRSLHSSLFLASLTTFVLLSSALLIGYLDSASPNPIVKDESSSDVSVVPVARASDRSSARIKTPAHSERKSNVNRSHIWPGFSASARRHATMNGSLARSHQATYVGKTLRKSEVARQKNPQRTSPSQQVSNPQQSAQPILHAQQTSHSKDSKLTAFVKSSWHVLKRPFKF